MERRIKDAYFYGGFGIGIVMGSIMGRDLPHLIWYLIGLGFVFSLNGLVELWKVSRVKHDHTPKGGGD